MTSIFIKKKEKETKLGKIRVRNSENTFYSAVSYYRIDKTAFPLHSYCNLRTIQSNSDKLRLRTGYLV